MEKKPEWEMIFILARDLQNTIKRKPQRSIAQERIFSYVFSQDGIMQSQLVKLLQELSPEERNGFTATLVKLVLKSKQLFNA